LTPLPHTQTTILHALDTYGFKTRTIEHEAIFTVSEGHDIKQNLLGAHTKNLFLRDDKNRQILISAEQSTPIPLKALPKLLGCGRLSFGSEERLMRALGVRPGSVSAFSLLNDTEKNVSFYLDKVLYDAEFINFHPLVNTATTTISRDDFLCFLKLLNRPLCVVDFETLTLH
jgi:Ala-tRNA(Pro) deacylase